MTTVNDAARIDRQRRTEAMAFAVQLYHSAFDRYMDEANGADALVVETARAIYDFLKETP